MPKLYSPPHLGYHHHHHSILFFLSPPNLLMRSIELDPLFAGSFVFLSFTLLPYFPALSILPFEFSFSPLLSLV